MNSKKFAALGLALLLTLGMTSCGAPANKGGDTSATESGADKGTSSEKLESADKEISLPTAREVKNMDYVVTALQTDHEVNANLVDGLVETDGYGKLQPAIAESWKPNDDASVWTFKIRPGVKWVTNQGEEYGEVTAEDFVTGVRHGAEFNSGAKELLMDVIDGYSDYLNSDFSDAAWEKVGVKAVDKNTLEFTMQKGEDGKSISVPYFDSMTNYTVLYPINKEFLESKGNGCKLGAPNKKDCKFGSKQLDSILYNGAYILTENTEKSKAVLTKNDSYWDKDHVYLDKITRVFDAGQDTYSAIKGFESGVYFSAALNPVWKDYDKYAKKYEGKTSYTLPNATVFGVVFNYNRRSFEHTNYAKDKTLAGNTHKAVLNENFRKALRAAFDVKSYLGVRMPEDLAVASMRNIDNFSAAGSTKDGKKYFDLVTETYNANTGEKRDLHDGQAPFYNKEEAMKYIEAAKKEGVQFPIHLDVMVNSTADTLVKQAQSFKKSVADNTENNIIIELVLRDEDTINAVVYQNQDPAKMDYDISTYTGWGPDFKDPKSFVDIYSPVTGYYMAACGLGKVDKDGKVVDEQIKKDLGFMDYEKLYKEADKITTDLDARYKAYAKADSLLIERCLYIPTAMQSRGNRVTKAVPFSQMWGTFGVSEYKYKGLRTQKDLVTTEQYEKAYKEFESKQ